MLRRRGTKRSKTGLIILLILILGGAIAGGVYLFTAKDFERVPPIIEVPKHAYWNANSPLRIKLSDNSALKSYQIFLNDGKNELLAASEEQMAAGQEKTVEIKYPKQGLDRNAKSVQLTVKAVDTSKWNLLSGNSAQKSVIFKLDYKRPSLSVLANSYSITQGGSALVIFQASDDDGLEQVYVQVADLKFKAQPYKKEGFYAVLIAWPFTQESFQAKAVAQDRAGNSRVAEIPFYLKPFRYSVSWIEAKDNFIDGKITELAEEDQSYMKENKLERLKAVNETMRINNEKLIHSVSAGISEEILSSWSIKPFYPLKNGQKIADFGDDRHYYYKDKAKEISQSYHLGYDLASNKMAPIVTSNDGVVVAATYNGIYGNMPIIDHGLGLYSLYGHCTSIDVKEGDHVSAGQVIATTGMTGLALGDHLHFGILVQGVDVRPIEWLDSKWIRDNVEKIFRDADAIMFGKDTNKTN